MLVILSLLGGGQEEPGWRGFALQRMLERWGPVEASVRLGVIWAVWHLPLFVLVSDYDNAGTEVRLWYDSRDVPFLREDQKDAADIQNRQAATINALIMAGFTPESSVAATSAEDWDLLKHTGLVSVQLLPPGTATSGGTVQKPATNSSSTTDSSSASASSNPTNPEVTGAGQ